MNDERPRQAAPKGDRGPRQGGQPRAGGEKSGGDRRGGERGGRGSDRGRGRGGERGGGRGGRDDRGGRGDGRPSRALLPLTETRRLDLEADREAPLEGDERAELEAHLAFLRRYKGALRLSLNAAEDLLVNGAKPPSDRGVLKHLFAKLERSVIEQALSRDPFKSQAGARANFLAGIVRLQPTPENLLSYLETLAAGADRREAAQAFHLTIARFDFSTLTPAQLGRVLEILQGTFQGADRVQVAIGLLSSHGAHALFEREELDAEAKALFAPLAAVHRVVVSGARLPDDETARGRVLEGLERWLESPDAVLKSYPKEIRVRLLELALSGIDGRAPKKIPRGLLDSIPRSDPAYASLGQREAERLLSEGDASGAKAVLNALLSAHPYLKSLTAWRDALAWRQVGKLTLDESQPLAPGRRLVKAFWLEGRRFGWGRIAKVEDAGKLAAEARLQADLLLPGIPPVLAHGLGKDGTAFLFVSAPGRPLPAALTELGPKDALTLALDLALILKVLAAGGIELPDADPGRFLVNGRPARAVLLDLEGALATDPSRAALAHSAFAVSLAQKVLEKAPPELLTPTLRRQLGRPTPMPLLVKALYEALAG